MNRFFRLALLESGIDTFENLSTRARIERTRLSRISNGRIRPRPDECERIAEALGVPVERLFPPEHGRVYEQ